MKEERLRAIVVDLQLTVALLDYLNTDDDEDAGPDSQPREAVTHVLPVHSNVIPLHRPPRSRR